ncbi:myb-like protein X isoform X2 [Pieris napi]|uniref:myb-like protein X isoform X2 n=1 Tax=Pieris napi TaxID=78633 RepID=UPI001FB9602A|nr:myb-like protein X isoform X2 [Pieris napi]
MNELNVGHSRMADIEEENMLSFHTEIGEESSVGGSSKMMMLMNNIHSNLNHYRQDLTQHTRSLYHCERQPSPMSFRCGFEANRFNSNKYPSSHRSVLECRSRSPLSLRSGDSVRSAIDITNALKCESFNTHELQMIKNVVCRKLKQQLRKRYEKNRNRFMLLNTNNNKIKNIHRKIVSSGETSDSPISSNEDGENQSNKMATVFTGPQISQVNKSLVTTTKNNIHLLTDLRMPVQKNMLLNSHKNNNHLGEVMKPDSTLVCNEERTLKEITTKECPLQSQRFTETATTTKRNNLIEQHKKTEEQNCCSSENEGNFSAYDKRKRSLKDQCYNNEKKINLSSPISPFKHLTKDVFKKPLMPMTKAAGKHVNIKDVISEATMQPLSGSNQKDKKKSLRQMEDLKINEVSLKSSFSKRKLFTQKDLLSVKVASDAAGGSPQAKVDNKEKNKARKLVTSQSCLNRNVSDEEDDVLGLIKKIIPAEQINSTSSKIIKTNSACDDKCNSDVSDTFTDETLNSTAFETDSRKDNIQKSSCQQWHNGRSILRDCSVIINKHATANMVQRSKCVKSFWDTDIESEKESETVPACKLFNAEIKGQLNDATSSTLNTTKHQISKNVGKVLTVQDLINKRNAKKKTLNMDIKVSNDKEKKMRENIKKASSEIPQNDKENINTKQNEQNKVESIINKKKKETLGQSSPVKKNAFKKKQTGTKENSELKRKECKRSKSSNRNCSGCYSTTNNMKNGIKKQRYLRTKPVLNSSLNTSDSLNISRTRSKKQNANVDSSKENISQLSENVNITLLSLRPRKLIKPSRTKPNLNSCLNTSDSLNISSWTRSKQHNANLHSSKEDISQLSENVNITLLSLRPRKLIKPSRTKPNLNSCLNTSDSLNISSWTRSKQHNANLHSSKEDISQLSENVNITLLSLRPRKLIKSKKIA